MEETPPRVKLLIVDDDVSIVTVVDGYLDGKPFELLHAYDGDQGLAMACREKPALILLDILMPTESGWPVCAKLKMIEPSPKIIIMTALPEGESDRFADFLHADDIIHKPFTREELVAKVDKVLRGSAGEQLESR